MNPKTSIDLFNKIRSQFSNIKIGDETGGATADPEKAVFFEFEWQPDADTFGSVSISIADDENMKVYYNRDLVDKIDESDRDEWYAFLKELKDFAVEHSLRFDVRDITKSNLTKQDYQNLADTNKTVNTDEMSEELARITKLAGVEKAPVAEGLTGTSKSSFENLEKTKLIVRHTGKVDETVPGARSRQIQSLYIENEDGERFKYPLTHLAGARAMTRHVANGGKPYDEFGKHIVSTSEDIAKLQSFSRYVSNKDQLNDNAGDVIEQTKLKLENLRTYVKNLSKQSHYEAASKDFKSGDDIVVDDETINALKDKFTMRNLDNRVEEALPLIHKIMSEIEATKETEIEPETEVNELKGDEKIEPYADAGLDVVKFITDKDSKIFLNKALPDEKRYQPMGKSGEESKMIRVLSDIASRMLTNTPSGDRVANFASRMSDQLEKGKSDIFKQKDVVDGPGYEKRNRDIAKALVAKYERSAQEIDPADFKKKKDIKGKEYDVDPTRKPTESFENWVDNVVEQKPYVSMSRDDKDGKMTYNVLDKDGKTAYSSKDQKEATEWWKKNYDNLKEGSVKQAMHDDAENMSKEEFVAKYGKDMADFWHSINGVEEYAMEPKDPEIEKKDKENATKLDVTKADKMMNTPAYQKMKSGDPKYADKTEGMGDKIADMAQSMSKDEFMSKADELGLTPEEAAEHYEKMQGGAHAGKFEGNQFAQAVQKAKAAGMKAGDKFKVGDQEYTLKDAIEMAGLPLEEFFSEEEMEVPEEAQAEAEAINTELDRIKTLANIA
jgi:hypothetical protein